MPNVPRPLQRAGSLLPPFAPLPKWLFPTPAFGQFSRSVKAWSLAPNHCDIRWQMKRLQSKTLAPSMIPNHFRVECSCIQYTSLLLGLDTFNVRAIVIGGIVRASTHLWISE